MTNDVSEPQVLLFEALSLASSIVSVANSIKSETTYDQVESTDKRLRQILNKLATTEIDDGPDAFSLQGLMPPKTMLQIFIRRTLLIRREPFARDQDTSTGSTSRLVVMECSISRLHCHGKLSEAATLGNPVQWPLNFFKESFGIAMSYVARAIRRNDFDADTQVTARTCPKEIVWTAFRQSAEIFEAHAGNSVNHFRIYMGSVFLLAALESLQSGCPMLDKIIEADQSVIGVIHTKKDKETSESQLSPGRTFSTDGTSNSQDAADHPRDDWIQSPDDPLCLEDVAQISGSLFF